MVNVALVKGTNRYESVTRALNLIRDGIRPPDRPVLIKPNLVTAKAPKGELATTHLDAVVATMDFLMGLGVKRFIVADGPGAGEKVADALDNFGYRELEKRYDVEFRDLNEDEPVEVTLFDSELKPKKYQIAKTVMDCYRVSVARMKTHNVVVVTLSIKNTVIGSLVGAANKPPIHQGYPAINLSMARIASIVPNDISIIDGVVGMEGDGPVDGTAINSGMVLASADQVACDTIGTELMGFDPENVGYLWYLKQMQGLSRRAIRVVGDRPQACKVTFKPHSKYQEQLSWRVSNWQSLLPRVA